jgi:hypothetical protein
MNAKAYKLKDTWAMPATLPESEIVDLCKAASRAVKRKDLDYSIKRNAVRQEQGNRLARLRALAMARGEYRQEVAQ